MGCSQRSRLGHAGFSVELGLATAGLVSIVGVVTWVTHHPLLIASLAPTAFEQIAQPRARTSQLYNVIGGQLIALVLGTVMVAAWGTSGAPTVLSAGTITGPQLGASATAVLLTETVTSFIGASQPASASMALVTTLTAYHVTWFDAGSVAAGVVLIAVLGEGLRRYRMWRIQEG